MVQAVCFDLDGVLVHTMPLHVRAWQAAARLLRIRVSSQAIYAWEGEPGLVTARRLIARRGLKPAAARTLLQEKERWFSRLVLRVRPDARVLAVMARLRARGVRLALVTGTSSCEVRRFLPTRTRALFDVVVTGDRVRHGKPHPEPYRRAMARLRVPPRRTVVVENAPYGIRSARRAGAGWVLAVATSLPPRFLREAHETLPSVPALCARLDRLVDKPRPAP